jgi:hypothetical protein
MNRKRLLPLLLLLACATLYGRSPPDKKPVRLIRDSLASTVIIPVAMSKEVSSEEPRIENERYDLLERCPLTLVCPDERGKLPPGIAQKCPAVCTKTRQIWGRNPNGSFNHSIDAVCPANYVQVASYNMEDEYAHIANPKPFGPVPIGKWQWYLDNGYTCSPSNLTRMRRFCGAASTTLQDKLDIISEGVNLGLNPAQPATISGMAGTWIDNPATYSPSRSKECYTWPCLIRTPDCGSTSLFSRRFYFPYQLYQCQPPPGIYATGKKAPISIVCVRRKVEWRQASSYNSYKR